MSRLALAMTLFRCWVRAMVVLKPSVDHISCWWRRPLLVSLNIFCSGRLLKKQKQDNSLWWCRRSDWRDCSAQWTVTMHKVTNSLQNLPEYHSLSMAYAWASWYQFTIFLIPTQKQELPSTIAMDESSGFIFGDTSMKIVKWENVKETWYKTAQLNPPKPNIAALMYWDMVWHRENLLLEQHITTGLSEQRSLHWTPG